MDDQPQHSDVASTKLRSIADVVEGLLQKAIEMRRRAAAAESAEWGTFFQGNAAAYEEWAHCLQPIAELQARIDEKTAMIKSRFPSRRKQDAHGGESDEGEARTEHRDVTSHEYHLIDIITGESHGGFRSLEDARGEARAVSLTAWQIYHRDTRVEHHDPDDLAQTPNDAA